MPRRNQVLSNRKEDLFDIKIYERYQDFNKITPETIFKKFVVLKSHIKKDILRETKYLIIHSEK